MRVCFHKLSDERHALEIVREDGRRERVECETRSYLLHDLLHDAVETEARIEYGFWGTLARGTTLAQMNDRALSALDAGSEMAAIERIVGALHELAKGRPADLVTSGVRRFGDALGATLPEWLTDAFVSRVQERMRSLKGRWNATPFGGVMELEWPSR